jgi:hypothetical protein
VEVGVYVWHVFGQTAFMEMASISLFWVFIKTVRRRAERKAQLSIRNDMEHYDREWNRLLEDASTQEALKKLADLCRRHSFDKMTVPRHTVPARPARGSPHPHGVLDTSSSLPSEPQSQQRDPEALRETPSAHGVLAGATRVACLDQLYLQAHLVWPMMCALTYSWAASGEGFLHIDHASTLESVTGKNRAVAEACAGRWRVGHMVNTSSAQDAQQGSAEAAGDSSQDLHHSTDRRDLIHSDVIIPERRWDGFIDMALVSWSGAWSGLCSWNGARSAGMRPRVKWAAIKRFARAIEKVQRSYNKDVSRLVDVVRQSIIFHHLPALVQCLEIILADPRVMVLRLKNRYVRNSTSAATGGYRDVLINFTIVTPEAKKLGCSGHVCELQLILAAFQRLKTTDGHGRYIISRNLKAE